MLGFDAVAKTPLAAMGSDYTLGSDPGAFAVAGVVAEFQRNLILECGTGASTSSGSDCNVLLGKVIVAAGVPFAYTGVAATLDASWYDPSSNARLVTFKFIRANTISILAEDRIMKIEPRLRKSN